MTTRELIAVADTLIPDDQDDEFARVMDEITERLSPEEYMELCEA